MEESRRAGIAKIILRKNKGRASPWQTARLRKLQVIKTVISINDSIQVASVKHPRFIAQEEVEIELGLEGSLRNIEGLSPKTQKVKLGRFILMIILTILHKQ